MVAYNEVAPVAMMLGSADLLRGWVLSTLAGLATDDEHHARLRDTLLVFLDTGGSYKTTAERLVLHKNTVQYRIRRAEESLGRPVGSNRHDVELALQACRWLGSSVLQPAGRLNLNVRRVCSKDFRERRNARAGAPDGVMGTASIAPTAARSSARPGRHDASCCYLTIIAFQAALAQQTRPAIDGRNAFV